MLIERKRNFPRCWTIQSQAERRDRGQTEESWLLFEGIDTFLYDLMRKLKKKTAQLAQPTFFSGTRDFFFAWAPRGACRDADAAMGSLPVFFARLILVLGKWILLE